jgi:phosphoglycolate phosphatase
VIRINHGPVPRFPVYLFDLDGTLLDSAEDICGAVRQVIESHGAPPVTFEYLKGYVGRHLNDVFQDVFPRYTSEQLAALVQEYRALYPERGHHQTRMYPGVIETLAALDGRKSIATTKGSASTRLILEQFGLIQFFDHVQGTDGFAYKPAPDVILNALGALGAEPGEALMVGDSAPDMEAGKRAGVKTCAVRYGYGKLEDLARFKPDYWIDDLRELV